MDKNLEQHKAIGERISRAVALRLRSRQYPGLIERFEALEKQLRLDFESAGAMSHPGDKGSARENILRRFLSDNKYLPGRYQVSDGSSHVVSTTGHVSAQLDLLFYDHLTAPRLLEFGGVQYFPVESCYGTIEVKSVLDKRELEDGFTKAAAFKRLRPRDGQHLVDGQGFSIVFAYTSTVSWTTICETIDAACKECPASEWPNFVVVLDKGIAGFMGERFPLIATSEIASATKTSIAAFALGHGVLLQFYLLLIDLLSAIILPQPQMRHYALLPLTAGKHTYRFELGEHSETGYCREHGAFLRTLSEDSIGRILHTCGADSARQLGQLRQLTSGFPGEPPDLGSVRVYNPDDLPLAKLLTRPAVVPIGESLRRVPAFDWEIVEIDAVRYLIPGYYSFVHHLMSTCRKCDAVDASALTLEQWRGVHQALAEKELAHLSTGGEEPV